MVAVHQNIAFVVEALDLTRLVNQQEHYSVLVKMGVLTAWIVLTDLDVVMMNLQHHHQ